MKMMQNEKRHICAFCKYWYDPANLALKPEMGKGMWRVDMSMKCKCRVYNFAKTAGMSCNNFESKF